MEALKQSIDRERAETEEATQGVERPEINDYVRERQQASKEGGEKVSEVRQAFGLIRFEEASH